MTLWLILTIMTSAAAVWLTLPLIRRIDQPQVESAGDIAIYRDQLQEVERELRNGLIDAAQAETARIEIKRRILEAGRAEPEAMLGLSGKERSFVAVGSTAVVVLGSVILYAAIGNPDAAASRRGEDRLAAMPSGPSALPPHHPPLEDLAAEDPASDGEPQTGLPTVEDMIRRLAARLARNPGDTEGWRTLGWSYLNIGRFADAAEAYAKAIDLDPGNTEFRGGRIEALVGAANGVVTPEARAAIGDVLKRDSRDVRARYFAGLASEQDGDKAAALAAWTELLNEGGDDESWASELRRKVSALRRDVGGGEGGVAEASKPGGGSPAQSAAQAARQTSLTAEKGPNARDVQAAEAMPPADRVAMIRGMVDGLASRLERSPRDADGWIKLIRSRVVLGEGELAKQALAHGLDALANDAPERDRIAAAARELGVAH